MIAFLHRVKAFCDDAITSRGVIVKRYNSYGADLWLKDYELGLRGIVGANILIVKKILGKVSFSVSVKK